MTIDHWPVWESAYALTCYDHGKRDTYPLMLDVARHLGPGLKIADLACGPAVIDGILLTELGDAIEAVHLLDFSEGFLELARRHLADWKDRVTCHRFDLTDAGTWFDLEGLDLVVACNGLFHVTPALLGPLYRWVHGCLAPGGVFVNHQTIGWSDRSSAERLAPLAPWLEPNDSFDPIDREIRRIVKLDRALDPPPDPPPSSRSYQGLAIPAETHLAALKEAGFTAELAWRRGRSAAFLARRAG